MIDYLHGEIAELTPATVTIDCNGVGYIANISLQTFSTLQDKKSAKIYIYESVRQDAFVLFGFIDKHEREVFMHLISVSGVGPSTARVMLSSLSSKEVEIAINLEDIQVQKGEVSIPAIGREAVSALVMLGFLQSNSQKVVAKVMKDNPSSSVEAIIKEALKRL